MNPCFYCDRLDAPDAHGECVGCGAPRAAPSPDPGLPPGHRWLDVSVGFPRTTVSRIAVPIEEGA